MNEHTRQTLTEAAKLLTKLHGVTCVAIVAVTDEVSDDEAFRRASMFMALQEDIAEKYPLYIQMVLETVQQAVNKGPTSSGFSE